LVNGFAKSFNNLRLPDRTTNLRPPVKRLARAAQYVTKSHTTRVVARS
jgi:hypothetical protein